MKINNTFRTSIFIAAHIILVLIQSYFYEKYYFICLAYFKYGKVLTTVFLSAAALFSLACSIHITVQRAKCKRTKSSFWVKLKELAFITHRLFSIGVTMITIILVPYLRYTSSAAAQTLPHFTTYNACKKITTGNIETLALLDNANWVALSAQERLRVLQAVVDMEADHLGLPDDLTVTGFQPEGGSDFPQSLCELPLDNTHDIIINLEHLMNNSSWESLDTVLHEVYHCYEKRIVKAYEQIDDRDRNLKMFRESEAEAYSQEFADYIANDTSYYYNQSCETNARIYAKEMVREYYLLVYACALDYK